MIIGFWSQLPNLLCSTVKLPCSNEIFICEPITLTTWQQTAWIPAKQNCIKVAHAKSIADRVGNYLYNFQCAYLFQWDSSPRKWSYRRSPRDIFTTFVSSSLPSSPYWKICSLEFRGPYSPKNIFNGFIVYVMWKESCHL